MAGKFVLKKGSSGKHERKQSALNGIESVKNNAPGADIDDQTGE